MTTDYWNPTRDGWVKGEWTIRQTWSKRGAAMFRVYRKDTLVTKPGRKDTYFATIEDAMSAVWRVESGLAFKRNAAEVRAYVMGSGNG
jgi:adenine-specific DNA methylase